MGIQTAVPGLCQGEGVTAVAHETSDPISSVEETRNTVALDGAQAFLHGVEGPYAGYDIPVPAAGMLLGRDPSVCHLIFQEDLDVSRYHCRVSYSRRTGFFVVTDLNSQNGVFNEQGKRLTPGGKLVLAPGQKFMLCQKRIVFDTFVKKG